MTPTLNISPQLSLPLDFVTEAMAILAARGAGKSNTAVVLAEEMHDAGLPWVAIDPKGDWHGIRSSTDGTSPGLAVVVFGGLHGDVPLEPTAGRLVADLVVEQRLTCVLDVSEMSKADQRRFLLDFAERLYRSNREPLHVFCEEADEYIPQQVRGESAKLVGAFETLVKRGRFRGLGVTLITQRSASLNKDVLTQCETLIAMRTPSPQDRKAILAWVDVHDVGRQLVDELPTLESGEAWVFSPHVLKVIKRVQFRRRRTFDSGATPRVGGKPRPPARLADVDLAAIKEAMAETIERAKADDPRELRKQITDLQRQLATRPPTEPVEVPVWTDADREVLTEAVVHLSHLRQEMAQGLARVESMMLIAGDLAAKVTGPQAPVTDRSSGRPRQADAAASAPRRRPAATTATPGSGRRPVGDGTPAQGVGKGERVILAAVAQYADGVTLEQLTVLTGYKRSSRNTYLQRLRTAGLVETDGGRTRATADGIATLGDDYEPLPTGAALRAHWLERLPEGERRILTVLIDAYPEGVAGEDLDAVTGYKRSSRNTYLQRLRSRELVTTAGAGASRAADVLFENA